MFLELLLSLATITLFAIFALKPTVTTISQLLRDNKAKADTIQQMDTKIQNLQTANSVYNQFQSKIPLIYSSIPIGIEPESFSRQIQGIAITSSVKVLGINISEVILTGTEQKKTVTGSVGLPGGANGITFSINLSGSYEALLSFLKRAENLRRPIQIDSINISSSQTETEKTIIMLVTGETPYLKNSDEKQ
jgi:Tfp pilus assembly protein PilO